MVMITNVKNKAQVLGKMGGIASRKKMTKKQWSAFCSAAARSRWDKVRAEEARLEEKKALRRERDRARRQAAK